MLLWGSTDDGSARSRSRKRIGCAKNKSTTGGQPLPYPPRKAVHICTYKFKTTAHLRLSHDIGISPRSFSPITRATQPRSGKCDSLYLGNYSAALYCCSTRPIGHYPYSLRSSKLQGWSKSAPRSECSCPIIGFFLLT